MTNNKQQLLEVLANELRLENEVVTFVSEDETYIYYQISEFKDLENEISEFGFSGIARVDKVEHEYGYYVEFKANDSEVYRGDTMIEVD